MIANKKADTVANQPLDWGWGNPVEELREGLKELKGVATP